MSIRGDLYSKGSWGQNYLHLIGCVTNTMET